MKGFDIMANAVIRIFSMDVELSGLPKKGTRYDRVTLKENINNNKENNKIQSYIHSF